MSSLRHLFLRLALCVVMLTPAAANAQTFQTLYSFTGPDGRFPIGVVFDKKGNLYGTTFYGGNSTACSSIGTGCGTVFKLAPPTKGNTAWTETFYSFTGSPDGARPNGGLVFDTNGNLYGTTPFGGYANETNCQAGCGTVFEFNPTTQQALTTIYTFTGGADGGGPWSSLVFDTKGALYSTTEGGDNGSGPDTVYKLTPPAKGKTAWTLTTLHTGAISSKLVFDKSGNLYGTTRAGGNSTTCGGEGCGTVFKLDPATQTLTTLYAFTGGADGGRPQGRLAVHSLANGRLVFYGMTTAGGGPSNAGTVFEFDPTTRALTTLYAFTGGADGGNPSGNPLVLDTKGALYGETVIGGNSTGCNIGLSSGNGCGTVFKLTPPAKGHTAWTETVLHSFTGGADGGGPRGGLVFDTKGALYGTTIFGGDNTACPDNSGFLDFPANPPPGCGVVFKLTP
jgi:uncharacterized repeat protein (TIGR03803 family)